MLLLKCQDASFAYDGRIVASGLDFDVQSGDYLCIVGENGSGKSTLLSGILGLKQPYSGKISYQPELTAKHIGYLPQQSAAQKNFPASVFEAVASGRLGGKHFSPFYNKQDKVAVQAALEMVGIADLQNLWFGGLSGGQQQRALLARALSTAPDGLRLLILDEPMNGLDPHVKQELYLLIQELNTSGGIAVIMVTHDVNTAVHYADKILYLDNKQEFFGSAHDFEHTAAGRELMRDSCGGHCAICGLSVTHAGHNHA